MRRRDLSKALIASATGSGLLPGPGRAQEYSQAGYSQSPAERAANVAPTNSAYPCGDLRRYGGDPTGAIDSSAAWQAAITCGYAIIPQGCSFKILSGATKRGQVTVVGSGRSSNLLCDGTVLTVINGTGSCIDNLWLENVTAPWIITRNPANWTLPPYATLQQSNTLPGYQPTVNDAEIWTAGVYVASQKGGTSLMTVNEVKSGGVFIGQSLTGNAGVKAGTHVTGFVSGLNGGAGSYTRAGIYQVSNTSGFASTRITTQALTAPQQSQQIGPAVVFTGLATDIEVSRIYGRFVRIDLLDTQYSTVRDCDFRGGKGIWGGINFDNDTNGLIVGKGNKAVGNTVRHASFSGIIFQNNDGPLLAGNVCQLNGESGLKAGAAGKAGGTPCIRDVFVGNRCDQNYYDGIDAASDYPSDDRIPSWHNITGNSCYQNGGDGINVAGKYNLVVGNLIQSNGRFGIWCVASYTSIANNFLYDNNVSRNASLAEILGGNTGNSITGNYIYSGAGQNSNAIYAPGTNYIADNHAIGSNFFFGNPAAVSSYLRGNVDPATGLQTEQSFTWTLTNTAGRLQHATWAQSGNAQLGNYQSRILNASPAFTETPTVADESTALAAGWKIGSAEPSHAWADTNDQLTAANALLMASIAYNDTGIELTVRPQIVRIEIDRVTRYRLTLQFHSGGKPFALNTTNIPPGKTVQVQFYGKLA
ncbi:MAG TPA: right-handed parallel beta-helix repeat-containing protein [Steroidobacteraceae bacterium]|nr:right-handed parallel beta-helix repeat-containing protein [Steroidobacteraceae bacterium]